MGVEASRPPVPRELNPGSVRIVTRDDTSATHVDIGSVNLSYIPSVTDGTNASDNLAETIEVSCHLYKYELINMIKGTVEIN